MSLGTGSRIAQYRVERKLGAGGMGEVYLARDERLDRLVAIKLLTAGDDGARRRLAREARAAASLDHPGICAVYEVGSDPTAGDFIAMQYVEGETLAARLRRGKMSTDEAMGIGAQIAEALVAAHKHGLVHRDLKPQNIIITPQGSARLLDFGLALHVPSTIEAANAITSSRVTDPNMVLGTPSYMSPEQVRNEPADFRSDVFSLGCVLYECLTGRRAFGGATTAEVLGAILHVEPPPVSSITPNVGPAYDAICSRMLEKVPSERFQSAEEALGAIRALTPSSHFSTKTLRVGASGSRRRVARFAAIAIVIVGGVAIWQWYERSALPVPPPEAETWYRKGVEAMRDGAFLGAKNAFKTATDMFKGYAQAYSRLAEADSALDDEQGALTALSEVSQLAPNRLLWPREEQLRFDAASAAATRKYAAAVAAYESLVQLNPNDAGRWLDLGRAQENSTITPRSVSLASYQKAVDLDGQYAPAWLRLGVMQIRNAKLDIGLASIDTAIHWYNLGQRTEGEAEAHLRKGIALADAGRLADARRSLDDVIRLAGNLRYPAQDIRAQFALAKIAGTEGQFAEAENLARKAAASAASAEVDLRVLSATGMTDLAVVLIRMTRFGEADAQLSRAIEFARDRGARRVEMRARSQQASLRLQTGATEEALKLIADPFKYFSETEDARLLVDAKSVLSRAHEKLGRYAEARRYAQDILTFANTSKDDAVRGVALENLAGLSTNVGDLAAAVRYREQIDELHRKTPGILPIDLTNHAELLILLGRKADGLKLLEEVDRGIAAHVASYEERRPRVAQLRALLAATEQQWDEVVRFATESDAAAAKAAPPGTPAPQKKSMAGVLAEYALSKLARSKVSVETLRQWPPQSGDLATRRERAYWVGLTLLARDKPDVAEALAIEALSDPSIRENAEQGWRLAAIARLAAVRRSSSATSDAALTQKNTTVAELEKGWAPEDIKTYFSRADLIALKNAIR